MRSNGAVARYPLSAGRKPGACTDASLSTPCVNPCCDIAADSTLGMAAMFSRRRARSTADSCRNVRMNRPAPASNRSDIPTCKETSSRLNGRRGLLAIPAVPVPLSDGAGFTRVARHAGRTPKSMPETMDTPAVNASVRRSIRMTSSAGNPSEIVCHGLARHPYRQHAGLDGGHHSERFVRYRTSRRPPYKEEPVTSNKELLEKFDKTWWRHGRPSRDRATRLF